MPLPTYLTSRVGGSVGLAMDVSDAWCQLEAARDGERLWSCSSYRTTGLPSSALVYIGGPIQRENVLWGAAEEGKWKEGSARALPLMGKGICL